MEKSEDIFEVLDEARKVGDSDVQLYNKVRAFLEQRARETATPFHGAFELTPLCNLDCKMCYVHLNQAQLQGRKLLPADTWIDLMGQAIDVGMMSATLTGGECLTYPEFDKLYLFLKENGIIITVKTNGVLLDAERIDFFKQHSPHGVLVSLYGHSDEIYEKVTGRRAFSKVLENIRLAQKANLPVRIMITPNRYIGEAVKETIRFAKDLGIPYLINGVLMTPRQDTQRNKENYDLSLEQFTDILLFNAALKGVVPKNHKSVSEECGSESRYELSGIRCGAGKSNFAIRWDGSMYPCLLLDSVADDPIAIGFSSAWDTINKAMSVFPAFVKCKSCSYSRVCSFCSAENEKLGSRYILNNTWCQRTWKMVEIGLASSYYECEEGE